MRRLQDIICEVLEPLRDELAAVQTQLGSLLAHASTKGVQNWAEEELDAAVYGECCDEPQTATAIAYHLGADRGRVLRALRRLCNLRAVRTRQEGCLIVYQGVPLLVDVLLRTLDKRPSGMTEAELRNAAVQELSTDRAGPGSILDNLNDEFAQAVRIGLIPAGQREGQTIYLPRWPLTFYE